jgi:hypothetical protein
MFYFCIAAWAFFFLSSYPAAVTITGNRAAKLAITAFSSESSFTGLN